MAEPQSLSLPTPEQFDAAYDGMTDFLIAFRQTTFYTLLRKFATRAAFEPMDRTEVTDDMVHEVIEALDKRDDALGRPRQRREFPLIKLGLQKLIAALQEQLAEQGGIAGILGTLIKSLLKDFLVPTL